MRVLLTGGTGYLGRAVAHALVARGHQLVVYSRSASRSGLPGALRDGDVRDHAAFERAAEGCDALVHAAALVSIWRRRSQDFDDVNVGGLQHALSAASVHNVSRVVYVSSFLALPPQGRDTPLDANDYQRTKAIADRVAGEAVDAGLPIVRIYPGVIYGPGPRTEGNLLGRLIADHLKYRLPGLIGPERLWSFAFVDDVAAGICAALESGRVGARYALGGDNAPQRRAFEIVQQLTGRRPPLRIPYAVGDALGALEELRVATFGGTPLVTRGAVEIFRYDWPLISNDATAAIGYRVTPLVEGIRRTVASL